MSLWNDVKKAAQDASSHSHSLRSAWADVRKAFRAAEPPKGPPTITVAPSGETAVEKRSPAGLAMLGRSLLLLAVSVMAMGLSWLAAALLGFYVLLQRLFGLNIRVQAPSAR